MQISTMGVDLAKSVFQVHGVDAAGEVVVTKKLKRAQMLGFFAGLEPCRVGLADAPGFGPLVASAISAALTDPNAFRCARDFAASLGVTPRIEATGGKARLGPISKRGDRYLRRLLINGAQAWLTSPRAKADPWIARLLAEKPRGQVAVAVANKMARIAWAMIAKSEAYRPRAATA